MTDPTEICQDLIHFAETLAQEASATVRKQLQQASLTIKPDGSPVTSVDLAVEEALRRRIEAADPSHGILGEEFGPRNPDAEWVWVIDPIDGTRQFAAGLPNYGTLIALCHRNRPTLGVICQPLLGDIYLGISGRGTWLNGTGLRTHPPQGIAQSILCLSDPDAFVGETRAGYEALRRMSRWNLYDGGCLSFGALAAGKIGISLCGPNLDFFDICALVPVVQGAGGVITDWQGNGLDISAEGAIVASAGADLHAQVLHILKEAMPHGQA